MYPLAFQREARAVSTDIRSPFPRILLFRASFFFCILISAPAARKGFFLTGEGRAVIINCLLTT